MWPCTGHPKARTCTFTGLLPGGCKVRVRSAERLAIAPAILYKVFRNLVSALCRWTNMYYDVRGSAQCERICVKFLVRRSYCSRRSCLANEAPAGSFGIYLMACGGAWEIIGELCEVLGSYEREGSRNPWQTLGNLEIVFGSSAIDVGASLFTFETCLDCLQMCICCETHLA